MWCTDAGTDTDRHRDRHSGACTDSESERDALSPAGLFPTLPSPATARSTTARQILPGHGPRGVVPRAGQALALCGEDGDLPSAIRAARNLKARSETPKEKVKEEKEMNEGGEGEGGDEGRRRRRRRR